MLIKPQIIELLAAGKSDQEIVALLGCAISYPRQLRFTMGLRTRRQSPVRDAILEYLAQHPGVANIDVARILGTCAETVSRAKSWAARQHNRDKIHTIQQGA